MENITIRHNVYGGNWLEIRVSSEITTEISAFRRIDEAMVSEYLENPKNEFAHGLFHKIELFRGNNFKIR